MNTKVKAVVTKIVVVLDDKNTKTEGGIVIPDSSQETEQWATVTSVGNKVTVPLEVNDRVYVTHFQGTHLVVDGISYVMVESEKILAKESK